MKSPYRRLAIAAIVAFSLFMMLGGVELIRPLAERATFGLANRAAQYPVKGVDVSRHQGFIDWTKVRARGFSFAYLKATEGSDWVDPFYISNRDGARSSGMLVGAYHFFTFRSSGESQAINFIQRGVIESGALPPALDLEYAGNSSVRPTREKALSDIRTFIDLVESRLGGRKVVIYTTRDFYGDYLHKAFPNNPLWFREVLWFEPGVPDGREWLFWQYGVTSVDGVATNIDHNAFSGTIDELRALCLSDSGVPS